MTLSVWLRLPSSSPTSSLSEPWYSILDKRETEDQSPPLSVQLSKEGHVYVKACNIAGPKWAGTLAPADKWSFLLVTADPIHKEQLIVTWNGEVRAVLDCPVARLFKESEEAEPKVCLSSLVIQSNPIQSNTTRNNR